MTREIEQLGFPHGFTAAQRAEIYAAEYQLRHPPLNDKVVRLLQYLQMTELDQLRNLRNQDHYMQRSSTQEFVRIAYGERDNASLRIKYTSYDIHKIFAHHELTFSFDAGENLQDLNFDEHDIPLDAGLTDFQHLTMLNTAADIVEGCLFMLDHLQQ